MKKEWNTPDIEIEEIKNTAAGGMKATKHDGYIYEFDFNGNRVFIEEYYPESQFAEGQNLLRQIRTEDESLPFSCTIGKCVLWTH